MNICASNEVSDKANRNGCNPNNESDGYSLASIEFSRPPNQTNSQGKKSGQNCEKEEFVISDQIELIHRDRQADGAQTEYHEASPYEYDCSPD